MVFYYIELYLCGANKKCNITLYAILIVPKSKIMNREGKIQEERMQFIASIAHEIRIPLGGIINFSELLLNPSLSREKILLYSNYVNTCSSSLLLLLNNLINSSKLESKQGIVVNGFIDLNTFIEECTRHFKMQSELANISLVLKYGLIGDATKIITDSLKLNVILNNLIGNALKFTKNGEIKVGYLKKRNFLEFYVEDTGIGIPNEVKSDIFKPFYQIKDKKNSSGLGLSITKSLVELLGGEIWFDSKQDVGTKFSFTIPYKQIFMK